VEDLQGRPSEIASPLGIRPGGGESDTSDSRQSSHVRGRRPGRRLSSITSRRGAKDALLSPSEMEVTYPHARARGRTACSPPLLSDYSTKAEGCRGDRRRRPSEEEDQAEAVSEQQGVTESPAARQQVAAISDSSSSASTPTTVVGCSRSIPAAGEEALEGQGQRQRQGLEERQERTRQELGRQRTLAEDEATKFTTKAKRQKLSSRRIGPRPKQSSKGGTPCFMNAATFQR
jgi:hypothetical protein